MKLINKLLGATKEKAINKRVSGATDVGKERQNNEDYFRLIPEKGLYIVADGMGGHNAGDVASQQATKMVDSYFSLKLLPEIRGDDSQTHDVIIKSMLHAHRGILKMSHSNREYEGMGCTVVLAFIHENILHLGHVGDARAYVASGSVLKLLTTDHSYVMELVKRGKLTMDEARVSPLKNRLNQAIGASIDIIPDYCRYQLKDNDRILLCSDGLWDMMTDAQIYHTIMQDKSASKICEDFINKANKAGGHDNITALTIIHKQEASNIKFVDSSEFDIAGEYSYTFEEE
ncbi:MAG: Stp1/IreP family PP2C-type Ser/Thr phosphatase [bacterium]|nr:Stp1/IreP family PP2C-type Ser/Thr phosphatase [bacterium]